MLEPASPRKFKLFAFVAAIALITLAALFYQSLSAKTTIPDVTFTITEVYIIRINIHLFIYLCLLGGWVWCAIKEWLVHRGYNPFVRLAGILSRDKVRSDARGT